MNIRLWARRSLLRFAHLLTPADPREAEKTQRQKDLEAEHRLMRSQLDETRSRQAEYRAEELERIAELVEARQMQGSGPWLVSEAREQLDKPGKLREVQPTTSQGAFGDMELALQNVEWRREINLSWLEFSRWGIQQIILISRLYYIKNPLIRRLIDIASVYVFGRGVEVTSSDEDANEVLQEFFEREKKTLGQIALVELEKRKYYDGNLFFALFPDATDTGKTKIRTIDATEIQDVVCDPNDTDSPWFYRRSWVQRIFDPVSGATSTKHEEQYYPSLEYWDQMTKGGSISPLAVQPQQINQLAVNWTTPILHRKCGAVAKWHFGCPIIYPALDWAKAARKYLEACSTVKLALARFAAVFTTKGGQQAIMGAKQQLGTTVGPGTPLWDSNPTPVNASILASGPGSTLEFMNATGKGGDPEEVRQYKLMACIVVGVPETFLADVSTGNLATATTLDRPTELVFSEKQEAWREDLATIAKFVLQVSAGAPSGKLKESITRRSLKSVSITEGMRVIGPKGRMIYAEAKTKAPEKIQVTVTFPAIREGDMPAIIGAIVNAATLGNKAGQIVGIDEKAAVLMMLRELDWEDAEDLVEEMYPESEYDPDRTKEPLPQPLPAFAAPLPGGAPQPTPAQATSQPATPPAPAAPAPATKSAESLLVVASRLREAAEKLLERHGRG